MIQEARQRQDSILDGRTQQRSDRTRTALYSLARTLAENRMHAAEELSEELRSDPLPESTEQSAHAEFPSRSCSASTVPTVISCGVAARRPPPPPHWRRRRQMQASDAVTVDLISVC